MPARFSKDSVFEAFPDEEPKWWSFRRKVTAGAVGVGLLVLLKVFSLFAAKPVVRRVPSPVSTTEAANHPTIDPDKSPNSSHERPKVRFVPYTKKVIVQSPQPKPAAKSRTPKRPAPKRIRR